MNHIQFDKKLICGPEFVAVRIIENSDELKVGNIWMPQMCHENARTAFCKVENVGSKAAEEYGIAEGDYVIIDRLSTFARTAPVAAVKYNNVICKTNETNTEYFPLKNMAFVEPESKDPLSKVNGIYVANYDGKLNVGTITKMNIDPSLNVPFAVGDKVMLTKGADVIEMSNATIHIYKHDMIVAKIID